MERVFASTTEWNTRPVCVDLYSSYAICSMLKKGVVDEMRQLAFSCLLVLLLVGSGCKQKGTETEPEPEFVPGEVLVSTTLEITNRYFRSFIDNLGLQILQYDSARVTFWIQVSSDSISYYVSLLSSDQRFLKVGQLGTVSPADTNQKYIFVDYNYGESNPDTITGQQYVESLGFAPPRTVVLYSFASISVPIGKEIYWANTIRSYAFVRYAELNYIVKLL